MTSTRALAFAASALLFVAQPLFAQDLSQYRQFRLGGTLGSIAAAGGVAPAEAKLIHQRPAVIQELRWRPPSDLRLAERADPVREVVFTFYNDALFKIAVDYDRQRTEGLTDADLIDALSAAYGSPVLTGTDRRAPAVPFRPDADTVVARWADADSSLMLLRGSYPTSLRLVVASGRLDTLARTAATDALRQDEREAPQRELDRRGKEVDGRRVAAEKARTANKPAFKP
jgi:hypothetical protein